MKFKDLIKTYRARQKMNKSDLARAIKKTDAYIRKLEVEGYTPPTFTVCEVMADALHLTGEERTLFFKAAFLERIHSDNDYYLLVHPDADSPKQKTQPIPKKHAGTNIQANCTYALHWTVSSKLKELPQQTVSMVEMILYGYLDKLDLVCHSLSATQKEVNAVLEIPPSYVITDLIESFKQHTAGLIRSQYPANFPNPEIWDDKTTLTTVSTPAQTSKSKVGAKKAATPKGK